MNIKEAKEQIKNAMTAYFTRDELGDYVLPEHQQRPVFLMGPPGIGKTAIMEQVAGEMGVGLLSYSMTHHTRQSALGLPYIVNKNYGGVEYSVSEYTMSEIIASVYEMMETTGVKEGILFLDEINCVSETLAPIMLQFLQYKVFGRHKVPEGWIVVTAGNPPEYNNSVREFDIVTWDRLKRIDVEPDFAVWKEYAYNAGVHPAVLTYLEIRTQDFYKIETTVDGKSFVTARGWEDLSKMIRLYERNKLTVDGKLVGQYIQNKKIAREFAQYYDLFNKYRSDYQVDKILEGKEDGEIVARARHAKFDERLSLIGMLIDAANKATSSVICENQMITELMSVLKEYRKKAAVSKKEAQASLSAIIEQKRTTLEAGKKAASLSENDQKVQRLLLSVLEAQCALIAGEKDGSKAFMVLKKDFDSHVAALKKSASGTGKKLSNLFAFAEEAFGDGQEMVIIVTELTISRNSAAYISKFGCKEYFNHNKSLLIHERKLEIKKALEELELGVTELSGDEGKLLS